MKNSRKNLGSTGQSTTESKSMHKHDANLQKNSALYFQIGLILCLMGTYALFEMQFQNKTYQPPKSLAKTVIVYDDEIPKFTIEKVKPKEEEPMHEKKSTTNFKEVEDLTKAVEDEVFSQDEDEPFTFDEPINPDSSILIVEEPEPEIVIFDKVEIVPLYPGCEKYVSNDKRRKCMSDKINKLIRRKFNGDIAEEHGLKGKQRIFTKFTIDKTGKVTDIKIRAPHPALEKEANRVINRIPDMKPGIQQKKPVGVIFSLPIVFQVQN